MVTITTSTAQAHRRLQPAVGFALFVVMVFIVPSVALAAVLVQNHMEGSVGSVSTGPQLYAYHEGAEEVFDLEADFDLGTYFDTAVAPSGTEIQLAGVATGDWWDTDWGARRCFQVDNIGPALPEHQVMVEFDSSQDLSDGLVQADGADYRALAGDHTTELELYVESGVGTASTKLWVQLDIAGFTTTDFCLYFGNSTAASVSSEAAVFTYSTMRELYFPAYWRLDGSAGNTGRIHLVSYVDNNSISVGGATTVLNAGDTITFNNVSENTTILSTGPLGGRGRDNGMDAIVPVAFAGTDMVFPTNRSNNRWTIVSPSDQNATVDIYNGTTLAWSGTVGATPVTPTVDIGAGRSGRVFSTNGVPVIVTHTATNNSNSDAHVVPPWFGDDLYGVRSRNANIGMVGAGTAQLLMSDGTSTTVAVAAGSVTINNDQADTHGDGTAIRVTNMTTATGVIQQADADGYESTAFLPERLLDNEYYLPTAADYVAFACPTATNIVVGGTSYPCAPILAGHPGHAVAGGSAAGTRIVSDNGAPFYAYYEDSRNDDETNLLGMKSAWAQSNYDLPLTAEPRELVPANPTSGTWTSPVIDTTTSGTNVFGLLSAAADLPAGTGVTLQVARGATPALALSAPFVGPDGTTATSFGPGDNPIPYSWDHGDAYYVVRVELTTTTPGVSPTVDVVRLGYDLPEVNGSSTHTIVTNGASPDRDWVLRIWSADTALTGATATVYYAGSTGLTGATLASIDLDTSVQVGITGTAVAPTSGAPVGIGPGLAHSLVIDTQNMAGTTIDVVWQARIGGPPGVLVPHDVHLTLT